MTGAGSGIGRALAISLAEAGADVALLARTESDLQDTARVIEEEFGRGALVQASDVTSRGKYSRRL